ncbi:unnamed protein product, partial [Closterium sp. NIES-54]
MFGHTSRPLVSGGPPLPPLLCWLPFNHPIHTALPIPSPSPSRSACLTHSPQPSRSPSLPFPGVPFSDP